MFDLDKTLVVDNSSFAFCRHLVRRGVLPLRALLYSLFYYIRHRFFGMGLAQLHIHIFRDLLKGKQLSQIEAEIEPFLDLYLAHRLSLRACAALKEGQRSGDYTLILSNSPSFLVRAIASRLGVDGYKSTEYLVDSEGRLCDIAHVMQGQDKALCAQETAAVLAIPRQNIEAYSDSILDEPLLSIAGLAIAVNPDRKLRHLCQIRSWHIL